MVRRGIMVATLAASGLAGAPALAGGGDVQEVGHGWVFLGRSEKRGVDRFDAEGDKFRARNGRTHDFRYTYLYFEVGILPRLQAQGTLTYLRGCESFDPGTQETFCLDGESDQWFGFKYQAVRSASWPLAIEVTARFPDFYDNDNNTTGGGTHWLGIYRHDYSLFAHTSHGWGPRFWTAFAGGYTYREGAPADVIQVRPQARWGLMAGNWGSLTLTGSIDGYFSIGNETPRLDGQDRFGDANYAWPVSSGKPDRNWFAFNDQDFIRPGVGLEYQFGKRWLAEVGYSRIVWGRSAHIYDEGWLAIGLRF